MQFHKFFSGESPRYFLSTECWWQNHKLRHVLLLLYKYFRQKIREIETAVHNLFIEAKSKANLTRFKLVLHRALKTCRTRSNVVQNVCEKSIFSLLFSLLHMRKVCLCLLYRAPLCSKRKCWQSVTHSSVLHTPQIFSSQKGHIILIPNSCWGCEATTWETFYSYENMCHRQVQVFSTCST